MPTARLHAVVEAPHRPGEVPVLLGRLPDASLAALMKYTPSIPERRWSHIRAFVENATAAAAPACAYTQERLLVVCSAYVDWAVNLRGVPMRAEAVFRPELIRSYISRAEVGWAEGTRRNYRALLMRVAEILLPQMPKLAFAPLNSRDSYGPYTASEMDWLVRWVDLQATPTRRRSAAAVLSLCAGAGLWAREVTALRVGNVQVDGEGVLIHVAGGNPREVPLLARFEPMLTHAIAGLPGTAYVFGRPDRVGEARNLLSGFVSRSNLGFGPRPQSNRMRATWLVTHLAAGTNMRALMRAGGVDKFENLARLLAYVPALDTAAYRAELRKAATT